MWLSVIKHRTFKGIVMYKCFFFFRYNVLYYTYITDVNYKIICVSLTT